MSIVVPTFGWPQGHMIDHAHFPMGRRMEYATMESNGAVTSLPANTSLGFESSRDGRRSGELMSIPSITTDMLDYNNSLTQVQAVYALQLQRQQNHHQHQPMAHHLPSPLAMLSPHQHPSFGALTQLMTPSSTGLMTGSKVVGTEDIRSQLSPRVTSVRHSSENIELPELYRNVKRKRSERLSWNTSETRYDDSGDDEESDSGERSDWRGPGKLKKAKPAQPESSDSLLSDITDLLSLPQKEAAQRLGISESMLCKRFKECTRRKWPYRYLRKIEKTIATLESQQETEPLSPEDQERLQDLLKQKVDCLAPVKIRITKSQSPSPTPCSRSPLSPDSEITSVVDEDESDDLSDVTEDDYEIEAVAKLIDIMRAGSPRTFLATPQAAF